MKVYRRIKSVEDMIALQRDIDEIYAWCIKNKLNININKCAIMQFTRSHVQPQVNYYLGGQLLPRPSLVKYLGVTFDNRLDFSFHIDKAVSQAYRTLGYILRAGKDFHNTNTVVRLFNAPGKAKIGILFSSLVTLHSSTNK